MTENVLPKLQSDAPDIPTSDDLLPELNSNGHNDNNNADSESLPDLTVDPKEGSLPASPEREQEVVDVESYQPCVVDLTCEEEDEVEVVSSEQPVIYLGTERVNARRRNAEIVPGTVATHPVDLTVPERQQNTIENVVGEGTNGAAAALPTQDNHWHIEPPQPPPAIDFQHPTMLFADLLNDITADNEERHRSNISSLLVPTRLPRDILQHNLGRQRSRSRSPPLLDYSHDEPRTPEVVNDLEGLLTEVEGRITNRPHTAPCPGPAAVPHAVHSANHIVTLEHNRRIEQAQVPANPPSPPPQEQPTVSCHVCYDSLGTILNSGRTLSSTRCGHVFCSLCIEESVKRNKQCPVCRRKLNKRQYHPLFIA